MEQKLYRELCNFSIQFFFVSLRKITRSDETLKTENLTLFSFTYRVLIIILLIVAMVFCITDSYPYTAMIFGILILVAFAEWYQFVRKNQDFYDKTIKAILHKDFSNQFSKIPNKKQEPMIRLYNELKERQFEQSSQEMIFRNLLNTLESGILILVKKENADLGIDYEEKAFYDILDMICKQYGFEFDNDKMLELAREIKNIVDNTAKYPDWSDRDDIKAQLKMDIIVKLHQFGYPPITQDDVYKNVLEQAENFKKNR